MVAGVVRNLTAESAERAALGAGAIVMDVIASTTSDSLTRRLNVSDTFVQIWCFCPAVLMAGQPLTLRS